MVRLQVIGLSLERWLTKAIHKKAFGPTESNTAHELDRRSNVAIGMSREMWVVLDHDALNPSHCCEEAISGLGSGESVDHVFYSSARMDIDEVARVSSQKRKVANMHHDSRRSVVVSEMMWVPHSVMFGSRVHTCR